MPSKNGRSAAQGRRLSKEDQRAAADNVFTKEITDRKIEAALVEHCAAIVRTEAAAAEHTKASKQLKAGLDAIKGMRFKDGDRIRIGDFIVPFVSRAGGGVTIKSWGPKLVAGKPQKMSK